MVFIFSLYKTFSTVRCNIQEKRSRGSNSSKKIVYFFDKCHLLNRTEFSLEISLSGIQNLNLYDFVLRYKLNRDKNILPRKVTSVETILVVYPRASQPPVDKSSLEYAKYCKTEYLVYVPWTTTNFLLEPPLIFVKRFHDWLTREELNLSPFHRVSYDRGAIQSAQPYESAFEQHIPLQNLT